MTWYEICVSLTAFFDSLTLEGQEIRGQLEFLSSGGNDRGSAVFNVTRFSMGPMSKPGKLKRHTPVPTRP